MRLSSLLMLLVTITSRISYAEDSSLISAGILGGLSFPSQSSGAFGYGFSLGIHYPPKFTMGVFYYTYSLGFSTVTDNASLMASNSNSYRGGMALMEFSDGFSAGGKLGIVKVGPNVLATEGGNTIGFGSDNDYLFIGPVIAYDYPLITNVSVGGEVSYLYTFNIEAPRTVNITATVKLNF